MATDEAVAPRHETFAKYLAAMRESRCFSPKALDTLEVLQQEEVAAAFTPNREAVPRPQCDSCQPLTMSGAVTLSFTPLPRPKLQPVFDVLNTPELLEMVLLQSSAYDVFLRLSLVCKGFRNTMRTSLKLQQKLFMAPTNPSVPTMTPFPLPGLKANTRYVVEPYHRPSIQVHDVGMPLEQFNAASVRAMLVVQPPAQKLEVEAWCPNDSWVTMDRPSVENLSGIRIGHIFNVIQDERNRTKLCKPEQKHHRHGMTIWIHWESHSHA